MPSGTIGENWIAGQETMARLSVFVLQRREGCLSRPLDGPGKGAGKGAGKGDRRTRRLDQGTSCWSRAYRISCAVVFRLNFLSSRAR